MCTKKISLLLGLFFFNKITFSQTLQPTSKPTSLSRTTRIADSVNNRLRQTGKIMESRFSNSEIKYDQDIKEKDFIIEKSSNIKIDVVKEGTKQ